MKKFLITSLFIFSSFSFAHGTHVHHKPSEIKTVVNKDMFSATYLIKDPVKIDSDNMAIRKIGDKIYLQILFFDRKGYNHKLEENTKFLSYNNSFPNIHLDIEDDGEILDINSIHYAVSKKIDKDGNIIFENKENTLKFIIYAKYDDDKELSNLSKLSRIGQLFMIFDVN